MTLQWLLDNGCELQRPNRLMLLTVFEATNGNPCKDCHCKDTCPAWATMRTPVGRMNFQVNGVVQRCLKCQSPVNKAKAVRRFDAKWGNVTIGAHKSDGTVGLCACGHEVFFANAHPDIR